VASADPDPGPPPPPPPPNVNAFKPVSAAGFAQRNGDVYAFLIPGGITCIISKGPGAYGCSGPIPAAPNGANAVTGSQQGAAQFANADRPLYVFDTPPAVLQPGTRINFRNVGCGTDGTMTVCSNSFDGGGFVISPGGSFVIEPNNPLLLNTGEGKNPYFN
jgi:hypothetical protein